MGGNGTIFGRSPNLAFGLVTAIYNVAVVSHLFGYHPMLEEVGAVNIMLGAVIAFVANVPELAIHAGIQAILRMNASSLTSNPGTDTANAAINGDNLTVTSSSPTKSY
jgi:hypothetical protein